MRLFPESFSPEAVGIPTDSSPLLNSLLLHAVTHLRRLNKDPTQIQNATDALVPCGTRNLCGKQIHTVLFIFSSRSHSKLHKQGLGD